MTRTSGFSASSPGAGAGKADKDGRKPARPRNRWRVLPILGFSSLALCVFLLAMGFWGFASSVASLQRYASLSPPAADGIVVLTGASTERLKTGMRLLSERKGERLLISGVNRSVARSDVEALLGGSPQLVECCVDLGAKADDTIGNAQEAAAWALEHDYQSLILVTDDYHMPRSLAELRIELPARVRLWAVPVPTQTAQKGAWTRDQKAARRLAYEYAKYLIVQAREALLDLTAPKEAAGAPEPANESGA